MLGIHPLAPTGPGRTELRDGQLDWAAEWAESQSRSDGGHRRLQRHPLVARLREIQRRGALTESMRGFGLQPSYPVGAPLLRVPIDNLLHSADLATVSRQLGPSTAATTSHCWWSWQSRWQLMLDPSTRLVHSRGVGAPCRVDGRSRSGRDADLGVDVLNMATDRLRGDEQLIPHLAIGEAPRQSSLSTSISRSERPAGLSVLELSASPPAAAITHSIACLSRRRAQSPRRVLSAAATSGASR